MTEKKFGFDIEKIFDFWFERNLLKKCLLNHISTQGSHACLSRTV
jgi:hypothetical protein